MTTLLIIVLALAVLAIVAKLWPQRAADIRRSRLRRKVQPLVDRSRGFDRRQGDKVGNVRVSK